MNKDPKLQHDERETTITLLYQQPSRWRLLSQHYNAFECSCVLLWSELVCSGVLVCVSKEKYEGI